MIKKLVNSSGRSKAYVDCTKAYRGPALMATLQALSGARLWFACLLALILVLVSSLGVIFSTYKSRQLFSDVQLQHRDSMQLEEQWGRLLLEQSTWASHSRVEGLARAKLGMVVPDPGAMIVIKR
jgi:cell division protein FtsL